VARVCRVDTIPDSALTPNYHTAEEAPREHRIGVADSYARSREANAFFHSNPDMNQRLCILAEAADIPFDFISLWELTLSRDATISDPRCVVHFVAA